MSYKIVMDSCGELPESYKKDGHFERVPLTLDIDGHLVVDDETFDQADFLKRVAPAPIVPSPPVRLRPVPGSHIPATRITYTR